ncbi:DinB family protein [Streptomyces longispororuber]|uniref:DinB family protein n=1 Tax=Streptomyces longispororuber TaxID=68230 RepID=UPI00210D40B7|nr:DinB family protein [Streptomyces longispororuber]MCQ4213953.1 DinB family protein [Streptomyces longispororuber]
MPASRTQTPPPPSSPSCPTTGEATALHHFLRAQRSGALAILEGLTEDQLRTPVLPSGWTPIGLVEHLGHAERHWFQEVARGTATTPLPWATAEETNAADPVNPANPANPADPANPLASAHPTAEVIAFYRSQCELSDAVLASTPLDARPLGHHDGDLDDDVTDLRWIILHMIEETARHLGHLDAARELLDGRTGLAPR